MSKKDAPSLTHTWIYRGPRGTRDRSTMMSEPSCTTRVLRPADRCIGAAVERRRGLGVLTQTGFGFRRVPCRNGDCDIYRLAHRKEASTQQRAAVLAGGKRYTEGAQLMLFLLKERYRHGCYSDTKPCILPFLGGHKCDQRLFRAKGKPASRFCMFSGFLVDQSIWQIK